MRAGCSVGTWKQAASMSPNAATASHASQPEGCFLPRAAAKATSSAPAGSRRSAATKKGPVRGMTPFMATMAVPQKKKGDTRDAHSQSSFPAAAREAGAAASPSPSPAFRRGAASSAPASTKHSTSEPVPTQSSESAGTGAGGEGGEDSRRARTAAGRRAGPGARARRRLRAEARGGRRGGEGSGSGRWRKLEG